MNRYQITFVLINPAGEEETGIFTGSAKSTNEFFCNFGLHIVKLKAVGCGFENKDVKIIELDGQRTSIQVDSDDIEDSKFFVDMALRIGKAQDAHKRQILLAELRDCACMDRDKQDRWVEEMNIKMQLIESPWAKSLAERMLDWLVK